MTMRTTMKASRCSRNTWFSPQLFTMRTTRCFLYILLLIISYFVVIEAQQSPFYQVAKFDSSVSYRTNVCERQRKLYADNISLSDALQGLSLSVVLTNYQAPGDTPFFTLTNDTNIIDPDEPLLFAIILDELAERAGFTWRNSFGTVLPIDSSTDGNKTWTDLLEWEVETFDLSAGKWDQSVVRMKREISFPEGYYDSSMILIHVEDASSTSLDIWSFLFPFQWSVWLLLAATVIVTGAAYYWLERKDSSTDTRELEKHPGEAMFYTAITFTGHFEFRPRTPSAMILTFSTTFIALIIAAVYTANLASFLVARRTPSFDIQTVEQAVLMRAPICIQEKVNIDDYISAKYPQAILVRKESKQDVHVALSNHECAVAVVSVSEYDQFSRYSSINGDCTLKWNGRVENIVPAGFALHVDSGILCTSLIAHAIDLHMKEMKADGFIEREWKAHLQRTGDHNCVEHVESTSSTEEDIFSLGVKDMAGIFIIHAILLALSVFLALVRPYCKQATHELHRQLSSNRHLASNVSTSNLSRKERGENDSQHVNGETGSDSGDT